MLHLFPKEQNNLIICKPADGVVRGETDGFAIVVVAAAK